MGYSLILVGPVINKDGMKSGLSIVISVNRAGSSEPKMMAWRPVYPVMPGERILYVDQTSSAFAQTFRRMIKGNKVRRIC